jgi:hypothetical protein
MPYFSESAATAERSGLPSRVSGPSSSKYLWPPPGVYTTITSAGSSVTLTAEGVRKLREAQVTHHACVRELLLGGMEGDDLERLASIYDHAMPGVVDAPVWPSDDLKRLGLIAN